MIEKDLHKRKSMFLKMTEICLVLVLVLEHLVMGLLGWREIGQLNYKVIDLTILQLGDFDPSFFVSILCLVNFRLCFYFIFDGMLLQHVH